MRKLLLIMLATFAIVFCSFSANAFSGGDGSISNPYQIATASDFQLIEDNSTAYYVLVDNIIDIMPLNITFKGHLDGQGFSISINYNYIDESGSKSLIGGLFQNCIGAEISNLILKGTIDIKANRGTELTYFAFTNSYSGARYRVDIYLKEAEIGGICANAKTTKFLNCKVKCNISWFTESQPDNSWTIDEVHANNTSLGGIVGCASDCEFSTCSVEGKLNSRFIHATASYWSWYSCSSPQAGNNKCGGLVGLADNCKIENSIFSGILEPEGNSDCGVGDFSMIGGFIGYSNNSTINYSYYGGSFLDKEVRRSFGYICAGGYINANQCFSICDKDNEQIFNASGSFSKCYTTKKSEESDNSIGTVDLVMLSLQSWYTENMPDWDFENIWYIPSVENGLPLLSIDPKISFEGVFNYGGTAYFNSQNTQKAITIESNNPDDVYITNNSILFKKSGMISLTIKQDAYGEYKKIHKEISMNIAKIDLFVSIKPSESVYGDEILEFNLIYNGFIFNDDISALNSTPEILCDASPTRNVGNYPVVLQGGNDNNYNIICSNGTHTIVPRPLKVTPQDCTRIYGSNNPTFRINYIGFVNGDNENIVTKQPNIQTIADKYSDTGNYAILCNGGNVSQNYSFEYGVGNLTIEKANLNISAVDTKREVGYSNPKFELEFDGFRNNDDVNDLDELPNISCEADILSNPGVYPIVLYGGFDNNYEYNLKNGQLIVEENKNTIVLIESIMITPESLEGRPGETFTVNAIILPKDASNQTLTWTSSDDAIATVDDSGVITALNEGTCIITAASNDGTKISGECKVVISPDNDYVLDVNIDEKFDLYNIHGILIKKNSNNEIFENIQPGVYIIRQGNASRKIIFD